MQDAPPSGPRESEALLLQAEGLDLQGFYQHVDWMAAQKQREAAIGEAITSALTGIKLKVDNCVVNIWSPDSTARVMVYLGSTFDGDAAAVEQLFPGAIIEHNTITIPIPRPEANVEGSQEDFGDQMRR